MQHKRIHFNNNNNKKSGKKYCSGKVMKDLTEIKKICNRIKAEGGKT